MGRIERGTVAVLFVDFLATMGVATAGILYLKTSPFYLLVLAIITFVLFLLVWGLLQQSTRPQADGKPGSKVKLPPGRFYTE